MSTTFANSINNNPIYADRAEHDAAGNDLQTTYATKAELPEFSQAEQDAMDSGINSTKVGNYDNHLADTTIHVTSADKTAWNAKEDASNKKQSIDSTSTTEFPSSKATADFVNSSVATATANFLGNYTLTDLGLTYPATDAQIETALDGYTFSPAPTNNDYVYVEIQNPQTTGIDDSVERFKFNGTQWLYEYTLNNSSFTAAEKAAIDSGITSSAVSTYNTHVADTDIHVTTSDKSTWNGKQDAISDLSTIRSGASAGATAVQPGDLATVASTGDYDDLLDKPTVKPIVAGTNITITESANNVTIAATAQAAPVQDVEVNGSSVVNAQGIAEITLPSFTQAQADWTEADTMDPSYIQHKPTVKPVVAGSNITITEGNDNVTIAATVPNAPVTDVEVDGTSVVNASGVAEITMPTIPVTDVEVGGSSVVNAQGVAEITMPTFTQAQANWTEADNTDPSYIQNKPTLAAVATSGAYSDLSGTPTINNVPAVTSNDDNKVLKASYTGGVGSYSWEQESGGTVTDVEVDGTSVVSGGVASITMPTELVPTVTSSDNNKVLKASYSGGVGSYSWQTESGGGGGGGSYTAGTGIDITNDVISVDTSVVATHTDLADKEDAFTVGTGLEMDTTGGVNTLQVETPMDITAGPGIAIDNPDSDTLRVSVGTSFTQAQLNYLKAALGLDETVLYESSAGMQLHNGLQLPETLYNFERIRFYVASSTSNGTPSIVEVPIQVTPYPNGTFVLCFTNGHGLSDNFKLSWKWKMTFANNTLTLILSQYWGQNGTSWTQGDNLNDATVFKIVGIHRIANN